MMLGNLIHLIFKGISIIRWNNYPRIQNFVEAEHIGLKLNIAYIISSILREKGKKVDLVYIYRHFFWKSFFTFIYSDINHDLKRSLQQKKPEIYQKLWQKMGDFILQSNLHEKIKKDFQLVIEEYTKNNSSQDNKQLEKDIMELTKGVEKKLEIQDNIQLYQLSYGDIMEETKQQISKYSNKIGFEEMDLLEIYLSNLIKLKFAQRWNKNKRNQPISVLSHLFFVFSFSYFQALLKDFENAKMEQILNISLLHDFPETITGDVITPTKDSVEGFRDFLEEVEEDVVENNLLKHFSNFSFYHELKNNILHPFESEIGKVAKNSDVLSAMFETKIEKDESHFLVYKKIKNTLWEKEDQELDYILKYGVDTFEEDVEEKWKNFISK